MKHLFIAILAMSILAACTKDEQQEIRQLPDNITIKETALYPEGIAYSSSKDRVYVGSYYKGKIVEVDLNGQVFPFTTDNDLVSVVGILIDEKNGRLIAANSDSGLGEKSDQSTTGVLADVMIYDLKTGNRLQRINLNDLYPGGHFINDITIDPQGNIYATDSFSPVVYKIDSNGNTSILFSSDEFLPPQGAFGLNGIVYHPDGFLITGLAYNGQLFKIPVDKPSDFQEIQVDQNVNSFDGLLLTASDTLALVSNNITGAPFEEAIYQLNSSDGWETAQVTKSFPATQGLFPTTLTSIEGAIYVNYAYFPVLLSGQSPQETFNIQRINF